MGCACNKGRREQFEVVRDGGAGRSVFRTGQQATALSVQGRYDGSVVRNATTGEVVHPGTGSLELLSAEGKILFRTDDTALLVKAAARHEGATARDTTTGLACDLPAPAATKTIGRA